MLVISHNFFLERMLIIRCVKVWVFSFSMTKQLSKIEILAVLMQIDLGYLLQMQMQSRDKICLQGAKTFAQCKLKIFLFFFELNVKVYKNVVFISHSRVASTRYFMYVKLYFSRFQMCLHVVQLHFHAIEERRNLTEKASTIFKDIDT